MTEMGSRNIAWLCPATETMGSASLCSIILMCIFDSRFGRREDGVLLAVMLKGGMEKQLPDDYLNLNR